VIERISQAAIAPAAHDDDPALAAAPGDRSGTAIGAKRATVSRGEQRGGLGQHGAENDRAYAWDGPKDAHVARPVIVVLLPEFIEQPFQLLEAELSLFMHHTEPRQQQRDVSPRCFLRPRRQRHGRFTKNRKNLVGTEAPDPVALQELLNGPMLRPAVVTVHSLEKIPEPRILSPGTEL
jgi:hypothetical protein